MTLKWMVKKWKRCLLTVMMVVVMSIMMTNVSTRRLPSHRRSDRRASARTESTPFIPDFPNQTRIGKPPTIPRKFLVEEADACVREGEDVEVVAYVHSAISRVKERQQTRDTWASAAKPKMVVVFMVGRAKNDKEREIVQEESEIFHDIVQGDYGDHYNLLTYKALSSLHWVTHNCAHVPWTLHVDDDLLIDTFILHQLIKEFDSSSKRDMLHCRMLKKIKVNRKGRWKVNRKELSLRRYPPFCQGTVWMIPTKEVPRLLDGVPSVKYLWVDDAYITGMLARKVGIKISPIPDERFGIAKYSDKDIGQKMAWFHIKGRNHTDLWQLILNHHNGTDLE